MTVRWKPLLILSGLFFMVAVVGVIAMAWTLVPKSAQGVLTQARAEVAAGRFDHAEIHFKQALQFEAKNASIHLEFADLYRTWAQVAPAEKQETLGNERISHLRKAVNFDKSSKEPRLQLLELAMAQDNPGDAVYWSRELLKVDATNTDAHYVLAFEELETRTPNVPEVKHHLKALEEGQAPPIRLALIRVRLAQATSDDKARTVAFAQARPIAIPANGSAIDRLAKLRLEAIEIQDQKDDARLGEQVQSLLTHAQELIADPNLSAGRVTRLSQLLEQTQRALILRRPKKSQAGKDAVEAPVDAIEVQLEAIFQKALASKEKAELQVYLGYADHLRFRQQPDRCLKVAEEALGLPAASQPSNVISVMGLHALAVEMALARQDDQKRYDKAAPHIQALIATSEPRFQGLGHLFQGAIELEQSGLARAVGRAGEPNAPVPSGQPKLRASALNHLKLAAAQLPGVAEAQARYGVALVLSQEQSLGRQFLQNALRTGNLEPQYQFWAAWTILQAGYPEEAQPILEALFRHLAQGTIPAELEGTLHRLSGEVYQARRAPGDLERAAQEFEKAVALGQGRDPGAVLRQAQIEVQLGRGDQALTRLGSLSGQGLGGPEADNLAVLILEEQGKKEEARARLSAARKRFPKSSELVGLEAALLTRDGKAVEADAVLKEYLTAEPENLSLSLMRAQVLADSLKRPKDARELLLCGLRAFREFLAAGPARPARHGSKRSRGRRGHDHQGPHTLERVGHRRHPRGATRAQARQDPGRSRALHPGPQERPGQQDRPVLEGPARQPCRLGDRSHPDARRPGQESAQQGSGCRRLPALGRPVRPGQPLAPDRKVRRSDPPVRRAEKEQ